MYDPYTGLIWPQRFDRAEITAQEGLPIRKTLDWVSLDFEPEIVVPEDVWADWDAVNETFITSAEKLEREKAAAADALVAAETALADANAAKDALEAEKVAQTAEEKAACEAGMAALEEAKAALEGLAEDATEEEIAAAEAAVEEAQAALDALINCVTPEEEAAADEAIVSAGAAIEAATAAKEEADAKEYYTAKIKSVVYYPEDLWDTVRWHDGSPLTLADMIFDWIIGLDMGKEGSPIYDESYAPNAAAILANFEGWKIVSEKPLIIEAYYTSMQTDAELNIGAFWPSFSYGEGSWHVLAAAAEADKDDLVAFSADKADQESTETKTVEWLNLIGGPSLDILTEKLTEMAAEGYIPYANVLSDYITPEEATERYNNAIAFFKKYNNYNIGTGPYILSQVALTEKVGTLSNNFDFVDPVDKWARYGDPKIAELEIDGPDTAPLGTDIVFDVYVTFKGEPYTADELERVFGLVYDGTNTIKATIEAELVEEGHYTITVPADTLAEFVAGSSKIEVVTVSKVVAIPTFETFEFVTVE